jgi:hypothetical protein
MREQQQQTTKQQQHQQRPEDISQLEVAELPVFYQLKHATRQGLLATTCLKPHRICGLSCVSASVNSAPW